MAEKAERLDKILAHQENLSRKDARKLILKGRVTVKGNVILEIDKKILPQTDSVQVDGKSVDYAKNLYLMLNKPPGVVSATSGKTGEVTVVDLVPPEYQRKGLFPAGRLDKDTVGFVLLTDDGAFAHSILSPRRHVPKTYEALLKNPVGQKEIDIFSEGLVFQSGEQLKSAELLPLPPQNPNENRVQIVLHEGRYHQIRRMMKALGNEVLWLKRIQMGNLPLDPSLQPGEMRTLSSEELEEIKASRPLPDCTK